MLNFGGKKKQAQQNNLAQKRAVAEAALDFIEPEMVVGVGTGSTVDCFIAGLAKLKGKIDGAVASSRRTAEALKAHNIRVLDLNATGNIPIYFDGADEVNADKQMIKGGGGALTGEKIVASAAEKFICLVDATKQVESLGAFPVAVEVIPMARSLVGRHLVKLGASPEYRHDFVSDYGNYILDTYNLDLSDPLKMEHWLNQLPGVVENGIFAARCADIVLLADDAGVREL